MSSSNTYGFNQLVDLCKQTHQEMQRRAGRSVDIHLVIRNWLFGWYMVEYDQQGADRAEYGAQLVSRLSETLGKQMGRGFSTRTLEQCRKFYMAQKQIPQTVSAQLGAPGKGSGTQQCLPIPTVISALPAGALFKPEDWQDIVTALLQ